MALEQVEHTFHMRSTYAARVRRERRVPVAHGGGALDELLPHWRSSVSSESGVPKEANTLGKGVCGPSLDFQAAVQLGSWSAVIS